MRVSRIFRLWQQDHTIRSKIEVFRVLNKQKNNVVNNKFHQKESLLISLSFLRAKILEAWLYDNNTTAVSESNQLENDESKSESDDDEEEHFKDQDDDDDEDKEEDEEEEKCSNDEENS